MESPQTTHKVALNADVVGYSRLFADDPSGVTRRMGELNELVGRSVAQNHGRVAQFVGDNFMALFDAPVDAVRAAIEITKAIEADPGGDAATPIRFRMGIDMGEVIEHADNLHGDALNIAARVQAIAPPGGFSVSGRVFRALDEPSLRFRALGRQQMKNIPESVAVYEFKDLPSGADRPASGSLGLEAPTVAVLPIHTATADEGTAGVARMIRSEIVHRLAALPQLKVVDAREAPDARSSDAGARYMLESGVHPVEGSIRIYAALFDVSTMNVVKSHKWVAPAEDLAGLTDSIAADVAHSVEIELVIGEPAGLYADLKDPVAIEQVYLGWYHLRTDTREGFERALEMFGAVAEAHPEQPFGHVLGAFALWTAAANGWRDEEAALEEAWRRADEGVGVGDPTGMARMVQAAILLQRGDADGALAALDEAQIIRPTCDVTYGLEGSVRRYLGQWEKAIELVDRAMRLTRFNKPWYPTVKAASLLLGDRPQDAADLAEQVLEHQPNSLEALIVLATAQAEMGLGRRAEATLDIISERFPAVDVDAWLDRRPYIDADIVAGWKSKLAAAGTT